MALFKQMVELNVRFKGSTAMHSSKAEIAYSNSLDLKMALASSFLTAEAFIPLIVLMASDKSGSTLSTSASICLPRFSLPL